MTLSEAGRGGDEKPASSVVARYDLALRCRMGSSLSGFEKWLRDNGGAWRKEREAGGWRIVASAKGVSRHARADDDHGVTRALGEAVKELERVIAGQLAR
jgi:hypothetical protein